MKPIAHPNPLVNVDVIRAMSKQVGVFGASGLGCPWSFSSWFLFTPPPV
jgi:hypothetical protein